MTKFEELLREAINNGISVDENYCFKGNLSGLYIDGNVALSNRLQTTSEKICILAEELGHYHTTYGNILDLDNIQNQKQELRARMWAYDRQIGLLGIIRCFEAGCRSQSEMAEFLDVTEEFLQEALERYRHKYGVCTSVDRFIIYFEPALAVVRIDEP